MIDPTYHKNQTSQQQHNFLINNIQSYNDNTTNMDNDAGNKLLRTPPLAVGVNFMQQADTRTPTTPTVSSNISTSDSCTNIGSNAMVFDYRQLEQDNVHSSKAPLLAVPNNVTHAPSAIYINTMAHQQPMSMPHGQCKPANTTSPYNNIRVLSTAGTPPRRNGCELMGGILQDFQPQLQPVDIVQLHTPDASHEAQLYSNHGHPLHHQGHMSMLLPQSYAASQHFTAAASVHNVTDHTVQLQLTPPAQEIYMHATDGHHTANQPSKLMSSTQNTNTGEKSQNSTVVLDRINICINNHYVDTSSALPSGLGCSATKAIISKQQQASPIIPAIRHKIVETNDVKHDDIQSHSVADEPDSTTTTQTPPTTPENVTTPILPIADQSELSQLTLPSPPSSCTNQFNDDGSMYDKTTNNTSKESTATTNEELNSKTAAAIQSSTTTTTTCAPPTPPTSSSPLLENSYAIDEDVFIQREDGRFYLGTIIDCVRQEYLIRYDDRSEQWCSYHAMRKLLINLNNNDEPSRRMCITCKSDQSEDIVEVCERCGRGSHRHCTTEVRNGNWFCKRCAKPMKIERENSWAIMEQTQAICYCGKNKKPNEPVLNCCKCQTIYHVQCVDCIKNTPLCGDGFFVFGCLLCNRGVEFLRRLQMTWTDIVHLALYNLTLTKSQHHKYYHIRKDILPFVLENQERLAIPCKWLNCSEEKVLEQIKQTVKEGSNRFVSPVGRFSSDHLYYGLRNFEPPSVPKFKVHANVTLTDELLKRNMQLKLLEDIPVMHPVETAYNGVTNIKAERTKDVYEFCGDEDTTDDEIPIKHIIEKCRKSSKAYMLKINKHKMLKCNDDNASDTINDSSIHLGSNAVQQTYRERILIKNESAQSLCIDKNSNAIYKQDAHVDIKKPKTELSPLALLERNSRKRKAFTSSKSYKDNAGELATTKSYDNNRICYSSSDENSSSSRGTSLDAIIPPPKNFRGLNNPFRLVTPKKNTENIKKGVNQFGGNGKMIKKSIINTNGLNFSSELSALKKAGIFSNLSTSELAKAAGQPRTVRTIKRRLSAKDITIGPNQEIRRRRTRRISTNVEVISSTTINAIPSNIFPIYAKDITASNSKWNPQQNNLSKSTSASTSAVANSQYANTADSLESLPALHPTATTTSTTVGGTSHGRQLRQRPRKISPINSRRSSISGTSTYSNSSSGVGINCNVTVTLANTTAASAVANNGNSVDINMKDLKETVNIYFGAVNRIESGEQFSICAKRVLPNGQIQYLIEWGE